jgi:hypothetical protein
MDIEKLDIGVTMFHLNEETDRWDFDCNLSLGQDVSSDIDSPIAIGEVKENFKIQWGYLFKNNKLSY